MTVYTIFCPLSKEPTIAMEHFTPQKGKHSTTALYVQRRDRDPISNYIYLNLGCLLMASSGKNRDLDAPASTGVGSYAGIVNPGHPSLYILKVVTVKYFPVRNHRQKHKQASTYQKKNKSEAVFFPGD